MSKEESKMVDKLYRCPECGDVLTEEDYQKEMESGSSGYCYCLFSSEDRILVEYEVFIRQEK